MSVFKENPLSVSVPHRHLLQFLVLKVLKISSVHPSIHLPLNIFPLIFFCNPLIVIVVVVVVAVAVVMAFYREGVKIRYGRLGAWDSHPIETHPPQWQNFHHGTTYRPNSGRCHIFALGPAFSNLVVFH